MDSDEFVPQLLSFHIEQTLLNTALIFICVRKKICTDQEHNESYYNKLQDEKLYNLTGEDRNRMCSFCEHFRGKWKKHEGGLTSMKNFTMVEYKQVNERFFTLILDIYSIFTNFFQVLPRDLQNEIRDKVSDFFQEALHLKDNFPKFLNDFYAVVRPHKPASCPPARLSPVVSTIDNEFFVSFILFHVKQIIMNTALILVYSYTKICTKEEQIKWRNHPKLEKLYNLTGEDRNRMCSFWEHFSGKWNKHKGAFPSLIKPKTAEDNQNAEVFVNSLTHSTLEFVEDIPETLVEEVENKISEFIEENNHFLDDFPKFLSTLDVTVCPYKPATSLDNSRKPELFTFYRIYYFLLF